MKYLCLFFAICGCCLFCSAETNENSNYYFSKINRESGLSQNNVKSIIQDSYGFMWFGTKNRLNRYDGTSMKIYDCYDPDLRQGNNNIAVLFEDKNKNMWIGTDKGIFIFDPVYEKFTFFNDSTSNHIKITDWVADICSDSDNNIWIVIPNQGLFCYHTSSKKLLFYAIGNTTLPDQGNPQCICIEQNGIVWVGTNGGGVYRYNKSSDSFTQYLGDNNKSTLKNENIYTMCDYGDELILGIHEGKLRKLNKRKNTITDVDAPEVHYKIIRHVIKLNDEIWVGTQSGLFVINELKKTVDHIHEDPMNPYCLADNVIEKIYQDKENGIWIGTRFGGVNYLPSRGMKFDCYIPLSTNNSISSKRVRELDEDSKGNIWIATEDAGLNIYDPQNNTFKRIGKEEGLSLNNNNVILGMLIENDRAWIGFFKNGLDLIHLPGFKIRHYSGKDLNLNEASIFAITEDRYGRIWIGNGWGVFVGDKEKLDFRQVDKFGLNYIHDIMEDSEGYIWVATMGGGLFKYDPKTEHIVHFANDVNDSASLSSNSISSITETRVGEIWLSTDRGGICCYNKERNNFTSYSIKDGLPDDVTYKILEDKEQNLWFGTNNGLVKFNPKTKSIKVFTQNDGLPGNQFNYMSALASSSGRFYFGGLEGLVSFDPYLCKENSFTPPVYITKFTISNQEIDLKTKNTPLKKSILYTQKITLTHNQSNIGFDFIALSYTAPTANRYAYKMENIDSDWIYTNNKHSVSYAKLPPGKYIFHVKGSNNDGLWNEKGTSIEIEILPPWWLSGIAKTIYIILFISFMYYCIFYYKKRTENRHAEKQKLYETEKEKELYSSKVEFFTNIAHEIRTPVTLINGPLEAMAEMEIDDPEIRKSLSIMSKNTSELLNLINQLLDFRKVDNNKFLVNLSNTNVSELLRDVFSRFESAAFHQKRTMTLLLPPEDVYAAIDKEAVTKILNNLFSNAIKYSEQYIEIELTTENSYLIIQIKNDGEVIPSELSEKIFDPFYQVKKDQNTTSSSGIGLSLARSLAELHNGSLYFGEQEDMNVFTVKLPVKQHEVKKENDKTEIIDDDYIIEESDYKSDKLNAEIIMVVEDNVEMLKFIADKLQKQFVVEKATNGVEALRVLEDKNIDLVLSDVMMPEMDGFELCRNIKTNLEYSHIPVVLLTAKNDLESKIHGLEMGADAYVEKPFSMSHLITQLTTLLSNRRREKEAFMRKPFLPIQNIGMNKADEQFVQKIIDIIQENITDSNFNVERLSESVFMSRSSLHRKIKALTELTPTDFIRLIRLKKAAELIQSGQYRVGEVCYLVGINSSSYFIKLFQKQFGMTPKEFEKQQL